MISLTVITAQQLGGHGVNGSAIYPSGTVTDPFAAIAKGRGQTLEELVAEIEKPIPIKRTNTPADIAAMAVLLASAGARNLTGQCFNVDSGLTTS